ncbi:MAG: type II toxin-antitoxin system RelE/ParE family toxin [Pseudoxanthomonas sp.]
MSNASTRAEPRADSRLERLQRWIAGGFSVLLHVLLVLVLLYSSKPTVTTPQGAPSGSRTRVDFIGETREPAEPTTQPPSPPKDRTPESAEPPPAASRVQTTLVDQSEDPVPPADDQTPSKTRTVRRTPRPVPRPSEPQPQPPTPREEPVPQQAQTPPNPPPPSTVRRPQNWGKPPGYIAEDAAPENAGLANSPAMSNGRGRDMSNAGPSMELGGYLVYYDVLSEDKLRAWKDKGIKELSIPLPGTRYYMVCELEIALKRGSGKCRALDPYDPEMKAIGDAREVVTMLQVYKQGELVWRGPGPYK